MVPVDCGVEQRRIGRIRDGTRRTRQVPVEGRIRDSGFARSQAQCAAIVVRSGVREGRIQNGKQPRAGQRSAVLRAVGILQSHDFKPEAVANARHQDHPVAVIARAFLGNICDVVAHVIVRRENGGIKPNRVAVLCPLNRFAQREVLRIPPSSSPTSVPTTIVPIGSPAKRSFGLQTFRDRKDRNCTTVSALSENFPTVWAPKRAQWLELKCRAAARMRWKPA